MPFASETSAAQMALRPVRRESRPQQSALESLDHRLLAPHDIPNHPFFR